MDHLYLLSWESVILALNNNSKSTISFRTTKISEHEGKVKTWGCRGSIAISSPECQKYGGNTTCFEIKSDCIPEGTKLMIDAGTGFVQAGHSYLPELKNGNLRYVLLFTHYHWDHIMGLTIAPPTFVDDIPMDMYGPQDEKVQLQDMISHLLQRPYFPVDSKKITHKVKFKSFLDFDVNVILCHQEGGFAVLKYDRYMKLKDGEKGLPINGTSYPIDECLLIKMAKTNHGNSTCITYRFEEKPTGKVFVLCTDHENTAGISADLKKHFENADLAIIDGQYDEAKIVSTQAEYEYLAWTITAAALFGIIIHQASR